MKFSSYLEETNTFKADVNEIMVGYYCLGSWTGFQDQERAKKTLEDRFSKLNSSEHDDEIRRAKIMASTIKEWLPKNGYKSEISKIWWVSKPGELETIMKRKMIKANPSDILIQFKDKSYLGISAKSTKHNRDIVFHNPGLGSVETVLGADLNSIKTKEELKFINAHNLSHEPIKRKEEIKNNKIVLDAANEARPKVLKAIRDTIFRKMNMMPQAKLRKNIVDFWMSLDPSTKSVPYIRVTGFGTDDKLRASVLDPVSDSKIVAAKTGKIMLAKAGNETINVFTDDINILRIRAKYGSVPLAAPIEFSVDPWSTKKDNQDD